VPHRPIIISSFGSLAFLPASGNRAGHWRRQKGVDQRAPKCYHGATDGAARA